MARWSRFLGMAREVQRDTGKSVAVQLAELLRLRFSRTRLSLTEYYDYRLFLLPPEDQATFVGWRMSERLQLAMTSPKWQVAAADKLVFYTLCQGFGLPYPAVRALYTPPQTREAGLAPTFTTLDEVRAWLFSPEARLPVWMKPIRSWTGFGAAGIAGYDARDDSVLLLNGERMPLPELLGFSIAKDWPAGMLFQDIITSHPELVERCGPRVCTLRVWMVLEKAGPRITDVKWRVASGRNMVDNYRMGAIGNSFGPVDIATGRVMKQIVKAGFHQQEIRVHPDTGREIVDFCLPDWEAVKALCMRASLCFGGFRYQGWDVALTDHGPTLVELNCPGDIVGAQFAAPRGIWDEAVDRVLAELGVTP